MREKKIKVYKFEELPEDVQEKVLNEFRDYQVSDSFWYECVIDDCKAIAACLGIEIDNIYFSGFSSQGDGACFAGSYSYSSGWKKKLLSEFGGDWIQEPLRIGKELQDLQRRCFYSLSASVSHKGHYYHELCTCIDIQGDYGPDTLDDDLRELLRDYMQWIYKRLGQEYDFLTSDESIIEFINMNEYEFLENGDIA